MTIMLTIQHVHMAGFCSRGARAWGQRHNFNYTEFLTVGIAIERVENLNDHFAQEVCRVAREEYAAQHQEVNNG